MITPYHFQKRAIDSFFEFFAQNETGNPLLAMPTGTGKSVVIACFIKQVMELSSAQRILVLTHVKELVAQNSAKLGIVAPEIKYGICSAGLNKKMPYYNVVFGGIGTVRNMAKKIGFRDLIIIDEAHLISPNSETTYRQFLREMKELNNNIRVIGLTATPYRLGQGKLTDSGIFSDFCLDLTSMEEFNKLLADGYICPLVSKKTQTQIDVSEVHLVAGEYNQHELEKVMNNEKTTVSALNEMISFGQDRKSWMIFATGINHAENISKILNSKGIKSVAIHSQMGNKNRDQAINDFKEFRYRCVVNNNVLTTGFDHPPLDLIGVLRPTMSTSLWIQLLGRGTRPSQGKTDCLVLDFAGNTERLGPINDPNIPKPKGKNKAPSMPPVKLCPKCNTYAHTTATICSYCGYEFPKVIKIAKTASEEELIRTEPKKVQEPKDYLVNKIIYEKYQKNGSRPCLKVKYICGSKLFLDFVAFEHPRGKYGAIKWWKDRFPVQTYGSMIPRTTDQALLNASKLVLPKMISAIKDGKYYKIVKYHF